MIAPPPGRGPWTWREWVTSLATHGISLSLGAVVTGAAIHLTGKVFWQPPLQVVGTVALVGALLGMRVVRLPMIQSKWALPQRWAGYGHNIYAALFGFILGAGVFTAISSAGFYTLLAYGLEAPQLGGVWPVFLAFGAARYLPLLVVVVSSPARQGQLHVVLRSVNSLANLALPLEIMVLAAIGMAFVTAGGAS